MPDLNTQLQQYYGPKLQLPKQVTEGDYSFESAKGHSQGMTITLSCNNCKYIVTTEACLQKESGIWLKCTEPEFNHASKCITLIKCNEKIVNNVNSTKPSTGNTNSAQFTEHKRAGNLPHTTNIKAMNYGNYTNRLDSFKNPEWNSQSSSKAHSAVSLASNFHYRGKGDWISCSICHLD
nr:hypothetical protein [Endozoicomonas sp.]